MIMSVMMEPIISEFTANVRNFPITSVNAIIPYLHFPFKCSFTCFVEPLLFLILAALVFIFFSLKNPTLKICRDLTWFLVVEDIIIIIIVQVCQMISLWEV